jgi:predicted nucleic acid-binding protein
MATACHALFRRIDEGFEEVTVLDSTVAEVVYVLSSRALYGQPRDAIRNRLSVLLSIRGVRVENRARCLRALDIWVGNRLLNFGDTLLAAAAQEANEAEIYSYDRGFDRVEGVRRVEP